MTTQSSTLLDQIQAELNSSTSYLMLAIQVVGMSLILGFGLFLIAFVGLLVNGSLETTLLVISAGLIAIGLVVGGFTLWKQERNAAKIAHKLVAYRVSTRDNIAD